MASKQKKFGISVGFGGADRDRTDDLLNAIQALSQLSYGPTHQVSCDCCVLSERVENTAGKVKRSLAGSRWGGIAAKRAAIVGAMVCPITH